MAEEAEVRVALLPSPLLPAWVRVLLAAGALSLLSPAVCKCCLLPPGARRGSPSSADGAPHAASRTVMAKIVNSLLFLDFWSWFGLVWFGMVWFSIAIP